MNNILLAMVMTLSLTFGLAAQGPPWHEKIKQIVPGTSSIQDVERLFASPQLEKTFLHDAIEARFYKMPEGRLSVYIAARACSVSPFSTRVAQQTVIEATFFPSMEIPLNKFGITRSKFKKSNEDDNPTVHFINSSSGLDYAVQNGRVIHLTVFLQGNAAPDLKCV